MELNVIIYGVVIIFITIIMTMIGTTIFQVTMPVMSDVANSTNLINATDYNSSQNQIWDFVKIALFICIAVPFIFIAVKLFYKKEPTSYAEGEYI